MPDIPLTKEQELLVLAVGDMRQAGAAALLLEQRANFQERRALETAISVCYARPWLDSNRSGKLRKEWLPAAGPDRDLHRRLLELRRKTYAHTDPSGGRSASAQLGIENELALVEQWESLPTHDLPAIVDLCERQAERFVQGVIGAIGADSPT
jgi:hypothetical protein